MCESFSLGLRQYAFDLMIKALQPRFVLLKCFFSKYLCLVLLPILTMTKLVIVYSSPELLLLATLEYRKSLQQKYLPQSVYLVCALCATQTPNLDVQSSYEFTQNLNHHRHTCSRLSALSRPTGNLFSRQPVSHSSVDSLNSDTHWPTQKQRVRPAALNCFFLFVFFAPSGTQ